MSVSLFFAFSFFALRCWSVPFFFSFLPACCTFSYVLFFFFVLDFSSRVPLAFEVLYSFSDSLFGHFYDCLFRHEITHFGMNWPQTRNRIMLHSRNTYTTIHIYMRKQSQHNNNERTHFFRKIYLSHFILNGCEWVVKGLCVRGELETEQTGTY